MKIDKKVNVYNTTASFIIFSIILVLGIVGMFMFLNLMGRNTTYPDLETTTTENKSETTTTTTTSSDTNTISYVAKLSNIIGSTKIQKDYDVRIEYQGTNYYFRCTKYDKDNNECNTGFALLNYDNVSIPLYIFDNKEDDFLNNNDEYYIIVDGEYVVLTYNNKVETISSKAYTQITIPITCTNKEDALNGLNINNTPSTALTMAIIKVYFHTSSLFSFRSKAYFNLVPLFISIPTPTTNGIILPITLGFSITNTPNMIETIP